MSGAAAPIVLYVGRKPTSTVARPITVMVMRKVYLRPTRSPMRPKISAPNGRTRNPAAYAPNAPSSWKVAFPGGKKRLAKNGARIAYREKSYHSKTEPTDDAM